MADKDGLKAQKHLAQGNTLGNIGIKQCRPERAKALIMRCFCPFRATFCWDVNPRAMPWARYRLPFQGA